MRTRNARRLIRTPAAALLIAVVAIGDVAWFDKAPRTGDAALLDEKHSDADDPYLITNGAGGSMNGNHPVAHPYPWGGGASTYNSSTTGNEALMSGWQENPEGLGIRLFNDAGGEVTAGPVSGATGIECSMPV